MKHAHMLMAFITIAIFLYQFSKVMAGQSGRLPSKAMIASHVIYTLLIITGLVTLMPLLKVVGMPHFIMAKIVLLIVAISANIKATRPNTPLSQAKVGMFIALLAYTGIVVLAFTKPANLF